MSSDSRNLIFILSDEHNRKIAGCYGHPVAKTPNLDRLADQGTLFTSAYCNSPICVPSRASLATGRYVHETGNWDNAIAYTGEPPSWHHVLREENVEVVSIGKLHYRGGDDYGFSEEILPLHVVGGKGDLKGLFRSELPKRDNTGDLAAQAGRGISTYWEYDESIAAAAQNWLTNRAKSDGKPFALFVSFVMPHFPLVARDEYYELYEEFDLHALAHRLNAPPADHPTLKRMADYFDYDRYFDSERRAVALRAYFGMVSRLDEHIGKILETLENAGMRDTSQIIYASDHGDNLGNRGMWGKSVMYEDSVGIPMIISGPDIPQGKVNTTPISLLDIAPTACHCFGIDPADAGYSGRSLIDIANNPDPNRTVMSEYHAAGSDTGQFMVRKGDWKYIVYVNSRPQLFNLRDDPEEIHDLASDPDFASIVSVLDRELHKICDPNAVNARAFADQHQLIELNGGAEGIASTADIPFTPIPATN
ncbi:MAG: sulfatase-like hydrolase/transferase [Pseudomonadota bacterium]